MRGQPKGPERHGAVRVLGCAGGDARDARGEGRYRVPEVDEDIRVRGFLWPGL
ncbi:hypothetical protein [Streptomyces mashuensis]|uniref:hypothetical protein n=1 Tax=Streptomyces mashuensis TaxID=33904 RepID=UPI00167EF163|nr:hypothetical protein [Streptomyces mashuensis]